MRTSHANDPCPSGCWQNRKSRCIAQIQNSNPDFVGTQELMNDQLADLKAGTGYAAIGSCASENCHRDEHVSIFYNAAKWQVLSHTTFYLTGDNPFNANGINSNTWGLQYRRACTIGRFQSNTNVAVTVCMANTHFDFADHHNLLSSRLILEQMTTRCEPSDLVLFSGDLNAPVASATVRYIQGLFDYDGQANTFPLVQSLDPNAGTWFGNFIHGGHGGGKIDYMFYRKQPNVCVNYAKSVRDNMEGYYPSDHAVVESEFCVGNDCNCESSPTPAPTVQQTPVSQQTQRPDCKVLHDEEIVVEAQSIPIVQETNRLSENTVSMRSLGSPASAVNVATIPIAVAVAGAMVAFLVAAATIYRRSSSPQAENTMMVTPNNDLVI